MTVIELVEEFNCMSLAEQYKVAQLLKTNEIIQKAVNEHMYNVCEARKKIIEKRECIIKKYRDKFGVLN